MLICYKSEIKLSQLLILFTMLSVFIACIGMFGLVSLLTQQKTKEIGIRKVLGASVSSIVFLLSKEFTKWVLIANIIAWPVGYSIMNRWLQNFNYHIEIGVDFFILAAIIALLIAVFTVSSQAIKAAVSNPVEALRYE